MADDAGELAALKPRVAAGEPTFEAFAGLRGVLALWIVLGHFTVSSTLASNLLNVYAMPGFFILSGWVCHLRVLEPCSPWLGSAQGCWEAFCGTGGLYTTVK
jgi:hypothetical protein